MVLASHCICTFYGFWLPNEERGSWSDFVRSWDLYAGYGEATKIDDRRSVAWRPYDHQRRTEALGSLKYNPVELTGVQALAVAHGFSVAIEEGQYRVVACSILPRHVHMVIIRHDRLVERIIGHMKARATQQLRVEGMHPFEHLCDDSRQIPTIWTHRAWKVFLDSHRGIDRAVRYVQDNPIKEGKPRQHWSFVVPYSV
jgi:REP element-mobilizing transposase RayT